MLSRAWIVTLTLSFLAGLLRDADSQKLLTVDRVHELVPPAENSIYSVILLLESLITSLYCPLL